MRNPEVNMRGRILDDRTTTQTHVTSSGSATQSAKKPGPAAISLAERFWPKVHKTDGCWLWTGARGNTYGHGSISVRRDNGKYFPVYAHRVAWEFEHGPIPDGLSVLHRCDTPRCVRIDHLFLGSQDDNLKDAAAKNRFNVPRPNHPRRKLSDEDVVAIRQLRADGWTLERIGDAYGVTVPCISQIVRGLRRVYTAPQLTRKAS